MATYFIKLPLSSGGGGGTWGSITGTLSNQTDLQTALNLKADDSAVVKLTGNQTIDGEKTFSPDGTIELFKTDATDGILIGDINNVSAAPAASYSQTQPD